MVYYPEALPECNRQTRHRLWIVISGVRMGRVKVERTSFGIALEAEHNLGSSVPACSDVFGHVSGILFWVHTESSSQPKVTDLQLTISIDKQVAWFQVTVQHIGTVNVFQSAKNLVYE